MISVPLAIAIHKSVISKTGGEYGIRDIALLKQLTSLPFQTKEGKRLFPSIEEKAGALIEGIVQKKPFMDGNKRMGYILMRFFLKAKDFDLISNLNEKYVFVNKVASKDHNFEDIKDWISLHIGDRTK